MKGRALSHLLDSLDSTVSAVVVLDFDAAVFIDRQGGREVEIARPSSESIDLELDDPERIVE